jgi:hypothetical protein
MPDDPPSQDLAWRFSLTYDGAALAVNEVSGAEMRVGPSDQTDDMSYVTGFWYELRDANETVLFRRITSNPMSPHAEIASEEGDFTRGTRDDTAGDFDIITPALADAATLVIFGPDPFDDEQGNAAVALATFEL